MKTRKIADVNPTFSAYPQNIKSKTTPDLHQKPGKVARMSEIERARIRENHCPWYLIKSCYPAWSSPLIKLPILPKKNQVVLAAPQNQSMKKIA